MEKEQFDKLKRLIETMDDDVQVHENGSLVLLNTEDTENNGKN